MGMRTRCVAARPGRTLAALGLAGAILAGRAAAQQVAAALSRDLVAGQLEDSYFLVSSGLSAPLEPLVFEARLAPHFFTSICPRNCALAFTPVVVLRMFAETSLPVRTPSYIPRATLFLWPRSLRAPGGTLQYLSFAAAHSSNGQAGPLVDSLGRINTLDGSFSTNYVELRWHAEQEDTSGVTGMSVGVQWHPRPWQDAPLRGRYGDARLDGRLVWLPSVPIAGPVRLELGAGFLAGGVAPALDGFGRRILSGSLAWRPRGAGDLGLLLHYYEGQDYYNVRFERRLRALRVGVVGSLRAWAPRGP